jgi:hypothetical protein
VAVDDLRESVEVTMGPMLDLEALLKRVGIDFADMEIQSTRLAAAFSALDQSGLAFTDPVRYAAVRAELDAMAATLEEMGVQVEGFTLDPVIAEAQELGTELDRGLRQFGVSAAGTLSDTLIDGFTGARFRFDQFLKSLLGGLARALVEASLLKAILGSIGGGFALGNPFGSIGSILSGFGGSKGMIARAQGGYIARGGIPGRDSIPALIQHHEMVLPRSISEFIMGAARDSQRRGSLAGSSATSAPSPSTINLTINAPAGAHVDGPSIRRMLLDNPDIFGEALRNAQRRRAI